MKPIVFTLITVTYNAEQTLERTLRSVTEQTYPHIEHILIDGASKDRTLEIAKQYPHLAKVVSEPDHGLYDAMNKGLRLVTGDYVCFLNAGDKLHGADTLEKMANKAQAFRDSAKVLPGVLYGHTDIVDDEGSFLGPRHLTPPARLTWKSFRNGMLVCHQAFYARRDLCVPFNLDYRFSADFDWCIQVMKQTNQMLHIPFVIADYLNEGVTTRNHRASLIERFHIMCNYYGRISTCAFHLWFLTRDCWRKIRNSFCRH